MMMVLSPTPCSKVLIIAVCSLFLAGRITCFVPLQNKQQLQQQQHALLASTSLASIATTTDFEIPRLSDAHLQELAEQNYVVVTNFLSEELQDALRQDVQQLRSTGSSPSSHFKVAKIGQDATNTLNQQIRVAETCFIGGVRENLPSHPARANMITILESVCQTLGASSSLLQSPPLDPNLSELLYAYYPQGGFYRRHRDAIPGSASVLRTFSLLLYLNKDWTEEDGGKLRLFFDSGGDELPPGEKPNYLDVAPQGGTLVLFDSAKVPHEVLNTNSERLAVVGWYNRQVSVADIAELGGVDPVRITMLAVAAGLVTVGLVNILS